MKNDDIKVKEFCVRSTSKQDTLRCIYPTLTIRIIIDDL